MRVPMNPVRMADAVRRVVEISAAPAEVFHALTDPLELAAWLGDGAAPPDEDLPHWGAPLFAIVGQPWRAPAIGPDGTPGWVCGEYLLVDPPRVLESTWRASWDEFSIDRVRFDLVPIQVGGGMGTSLTVTHTRAAAHLRVTASAVAPTRDGWSSALARLASRFRPRIGVWS